MRLRWWIPGPELGDDQRIVGPDHARDDRGRLIDGDRVPPPARQPDPGTRALTEPTQILYRPLMTRGQQWRSQGGLR